jgi:hypothetical protein
MVIPASESRDLPPVLEMAEAVYMRRRIRAQPGSCQVQKTYQLIPQYRQVMATFPATLRAWRMIAWRRVISSR